MVVVILAALIAGQFIIGLLIYLQGRHTKRVDQRLFSIIALLTSLWMVATTVLLEVNNPNSAVDKYLPTVNRLAFLLSCLTLAFIYLFNIYYPLRSKLDRKKKAIFVGGLLLSILSPFKIIAGTFSLEKTKYLYQYGPLIFLVGVYVVVVLGSVYINGWRIIKGNYSPRLRQQAATLLVGITLTVLHALVFVVILPSIYGQKTVFYSIGYGAPAYLIVCAAYGLIRLGLFDIRRFAARLLTYLLSFSIVSLVYAAPAVVLTTYILHRPLDVSTIIYLEIVTLIVAYLFHPLRLYFNKLTNRLFFRDSYEPQQFFNEINQVLVSTIEIETLLKRVLERIDNSIKPEFSFIALRDKSQIQTRIIGRPNDASEEYDLRKVDQLIAANDDRVVLVVELLPKEDLALKTLLTRNDVAVLARLKSKDNVSGELGQIIMGFRKNGDIYNSQDVQTLETLANELVIAVQNALRFEEIQQFNVTLQQKVDEATRKLRNTNDKLRTLDQTKDDFISMASHQLRTPLTSVKGYVSMVIDGDAGPINPMQRKLLDQSFTSAQRMVYLIADLLNISRLKTGKFVIEASPTNLAQITKDEISQLIETAKGRGLELTYDKPHDFPTYMLDTVKIRQVIMNFVDNAIYYTPSGGHIHVELNDKPKSIELRVIDDGIGVSRSLQHHLFTKFYRAPNAQKARPDGTGLGLFMAKKVVVAQGGAIIYESTEGKGSVFGFSFAKSHLVLPPPKPVKQL